MWLATSLYGTSSISAVMMMDALEIKVMLEHFTEENVETEEIIQFLQESARAEGNGSLRRDVILKMILDGHKLSTNQRDEYANKGKIYRLLLAFYDIFQYRALSKGGEVANSKTFLHNSDSPDTTGKDNIDSKELEDRPKPDTVAAKIQDPEKLFDNISPQPNQSQAQSEEQPSKEALAAIKIEPITEGLKFEVLTRHRKRRLYVSKR